MSDCAANFPQRPPINTCQDSPNNGFLGASRRDRFATKGNSPLSTFPNITPRDEARALGLKRYFIGEPCKRGHIAERSVSDSKCMECNRESARKYRATDLEGVREYQRRWRIANLEKARESGRLSYAKNRDRILGQQAAKRAANPQKAREYKRAWQRAWRAAHKDEINRRRAAQRRAARAAAELNGGAGLTGASEGNR